MREVGMGLEDLLPVPPMTHLRIVSLLLVLHLLAGGLLPLQQEGKMVFLRED